jgi:ribonuclease VapC
MACDVAPTRLELQIVCWRRKGAGEVENVQRFISDLDVLNLLTACNSTSLCEPMKFTAAAATAYGDGFSYALAKSRDLPLLFKSEDFAATDVRRAA